MQELLTKIQQTEHGFKHIIAAGNTILSNPAINHLELATGFLGESSYQVRMLAVYLLGQLSATDFQALKLLETTVADDPNWRVQEMLAKAFDQYCSSLGYEHSLPKIREWLSDPNPNIKRAVIEGLRIWTSRPYFKDHPLSAIQLISKHRASESEYLRKSVGNALRDISKKHPQLILDEITGWDLLDKRIILTYKLAKGKLLT